MKLRVRDARHAAGWIRCAGILSALFAAAVAGCSNNTASKPAPAPKTGDVSRTEPARPTAPPASDKPTSKGAIAIVDPAGLEAELVKHRGKVVLVDYWSTTCIPCIQGLPKIAELHRKLADKGFVVITMGMDDKQDDESDDAFRARMLSALRNHHAGFTNLVSKLGGSEEAMLAFGIDGGALPHYRLFDRDGKLVKKFVSGDGDALWDHTDVIAAAEATIGK